MFDDTVTLYHRIWEGETERWSRHLIAGVHLELASGVRIRKTGQTSCSETEILIPAEAFFGLQEILKAGDKLVPGNCRAEIERSPSELAAFGDLLTVTSILLLGAGSGVAHWKITCNEFRR